MSICFIANYAWLIPIFSTAQKTKFSIQDFLCKCDQSRMKFHFGHIYRRRETSVFVQCSWRASSNHELLPAKGGYWKYSNIYSNSMHVQNLTINPVFRAQHLMLWRWLSIAVICFIVLFYIIINFFTDILKKFLSCFYIHLLFIITQSVCVFNLIFHKNFSCMNRYSHPL